MKELKAGIDIGSTTVKLVVLDDRSQMIFGEYRRHFAHIQETLRDLLAKAQKKLGNVMLKVQMTGSGALSLSRAMDVDFLQEVAAVAAALQMEAPECDAAIELGGEDAKIIYFRGGLEERMNGVCAGGTGSFIDQMASLLQMDAALLNEKAASYKQIYPIAARCGVFAKSDIQPLINDGAAVEDLAASIFQAVVNQTISGLACGKPIKGNIAFLGGPLHYLDQLKAAFIRTLKDCQALELENSHLFAALGAAIEASDCKAVSISSLVARLAKGIRLDLELKRLEPLFKNQQEYNSFVLRHQSAKVKRTSLEDYKGKCFLGIDAGSTTTKLVLIAQDGSLLYSWYSSNKSNPVSVCRDALLEMFERMNPEAWIAKACSTGYGETLLKSAFCLDEGEVETIAHTRAASFFDPKCDCVLDIGGQDMKCILLKDQAVDTIMLNEACSSGCGSFIENFASSLGYDAAGFAKEALFAKHPLDLGTRCTVFMNSNVKQAQKEGASLQDISAGLAYSVIKNALYKVIKLTDASELGNHIVVQGGTFFNEAVLRAFEKISKAEVICPDIAGLMGAFGAALIARDHDDGKVSSMSTMSEIRNLKYTTTATRCQGCSNHCLLTISQFDKIRRHISGNRCERPLGKSASTSRAPNLFDYKYKRLFDYPPRKNAPRGVIGIPRVLNIYENYPFWAVFFEQLGFEVVLSCPSSKEVFELGMESIPSESECFPAKLAHGHVQWLIEQGIKTIFHPSVFYERQENPKAQNHFNCPIVISYPENIKNNIDDIIDGKVTYLRPFLAFTSEKILCQRLIRFCEETWKIGADQTRRAVHMAWKEMEQARNDIKNRGKEALEWMKENGRPGIVLAGRPYHTDPFIHHGIPSMITSYDVAVLSEDSLPVEDMERENLRVNDQWVFHSRLYAAAQYVSMHSDLELIQLNSFGCGLDAVTTDQTAEILERHNKLYTVLKIDEVSNLGAARIRVRSLLCAMNMRKMQNILPIADVIPEERAQFTRKMYREGWTILAPQMSPIHLSLQEAVFRQYGFHVEVLNNDNHSAIEAGLKYVNNDACFPSITVIGQMMEAVTSGRYDTDHLALIMTQTGGCCRASNYVAFIRKALKKAGLEHIPVISLNMNGMERNPGFHIPPSMWMRIGEAMVYGDLLMRCLYRVRPYEKKTGSANALYEQMKNKCIETLSAPFSLRRYSSTCLEVVKAFDEMEIFEGLRKPRVGVVGEILVKYMPLANNHLVDLLESEGVEAVVPDMLDFISYILKNGEYKKEYLGAGWYMGVIASLGTRGIELLRSPAAAALQASKRFEAPMFIDRIAEMTKPFLSLGNQYGEGWFLTGEMLELIESGTSNIVCIQPFGCLPNHVVGKGTIKRIRQEYPQANIVAVDYDPGTSQVNQLNRIKLMLTTAKKVVESEERAIQQSDDPQTRTSSRLKYAK